MNIKQPILRSDLLFSFLQIRKNIPKLVSFEILPEYNSSSGLQAKILHFLLKFAGLSINIILEPFLNVSH